MRYAHVYVTGCPEISRPSWIMGQKYGLVPVFIFSLTGEGVSPGIGLHFVVELNLTI